MNKRMKLLLVTLSLVVIMAVPVFANQGVLRNHRFLRGTGRQTNIEIIADKAGIPVEELLSKKESGLCCKDFLDEYGLSAEEIRKERLEKKFEAVDEKVTSGDITEEEGKIIKEKIQSHKFLQDCNGPHHGKRECVKLNKNLKRMKGNCRRGSRFTE